MDQWTGLKARQLLETIGMDRSRCQRAIYPWKGRILCHNDASGESLDQDGLCPNCCAFTQKWNAEAFRIANSVARDQPQQWKEHIHAMQKHLEEDHGRKVEHHEGNGRPNGAFAFTLTYSPNDGKTEADLVDAVRKVMNQRSCPVKRYAWYLEYGNAAEKRHPHIHGMYETYKGGIIEKKHWKRAWDIWDPSQPLGAGFRGGYHRPVRDDEGYAQYIKKQKILGESIGCLAESTAADLAAPPASPADTEESE